MVKSFHTDQKVINTATGEVGKIVSNRQVNGFYYVEYDRPGYKLMKQVGEESLQDFDSARDLLNIYNRYLFVRLETLDCARALLNYATDLTNAKEILDKAINKLAPISVESSEEYCG